MTAPAPRAAAWLRRGFGQLLFPVPCCLCDGPLPDPLRGPMCVDCAAALRPLADPRCGRCGLFFAPGVAAGRCGPCRRKRPPFRMAVAAAPYEGIVQRAVVELKFRRREVLGGALGRIVAEAFAAAPRSERLGTAGPAPAATVAMPMPRWRRLRRGFNQAELIAGPVARALDAPLASRLLTRRWRPSQTGLTRSRRRRSPAGSFRVRGGRLPAALVGKPLLLVDDVLTTGATANAAVRCLRRAGAGPVDVATAARTL